MSTITFKHGPVTITVDGLPESVLPAAVHLELGVHYAYHPEAERDAAFIADFVALGGSGLFAEANATNKFSVRHVARADGSDPATAWCATSKLQLYAPAEDGDPVSPALTAALASEPEEPDLLAALRVSLEKVRARERQEAGLARAPECWDGCCAPFPKCDPSAPCDIYGAGMRP
jgi:hypothetical protein